MAQLSDIEAGTGLPTIPMPVALSTGIQPSQITNRAGLHSRYYIPLDIPRIVRRSGPANQFFETLRDDLGKTSKEHCLFICWESALGCQKAVPLLIDDIEDEVRVYQEIVVMWYEKHGWWWRYIPFHKVQIVEEVEFSFEAKQEESFSVFITKLDIPAIKAQLTSDLKATSASLINLTNPFEYGPTCYQDVDTGIWSHENGPCSDMVEWDPIDHVCYVELEQGLQRKLDRLRRLSLPLKYFHNPEKAATQRTLAGLAQRSCIYRILDIQDKGYFQEPVTEAHFRGLMIQAGFMRCRPFDIRVIATAIVVLWKVSGGTWEAAFACGAFFIMLFSLSPRTWRQKYGG